ncbi:VanW family protein [Adlercreutzia caecimuris]|uniref:Vanomycin resistance protein VanB n=1 Tax=Adlercreutzia caecimuris TaxID=671266 RepID=A0A4S4G1F5_9ACTN|nr:VanW family protein [Adlercreutzia caecimuris]THG37320.1 hypothetical protein E5986_06055 [Adlercreutzia caecimuris]
MAPRSHVKQPTPDDRMTAARSLPEHPALGRRPRFPAASPYAAPLIAVCAVALSACMAFGNPVIWESAAQKEPAAAVEPAVSEPAPAPEPEKAEEEPAPEQETIGEYQAISQSEDPGRSENIRLATEAIDGTVIEPGGTFSFNDVVGNTSAERGYQEAAVIRNGEVAQGDGGGVCQVSTALYIAAVKADMEIVERHPHSVPSDYAPIGLDATIVYGSFDLRLKNNTDHAITIHAKAVGQTVDVSIEGDPLPEGRTVDATSQIVSRYERDDAAGTLRQYYVSEAFRVYYQDGVRTTRDLLSSDIYQVDENTPVTTSEGSVDPNK